MTATTTGASPYSADRWNDHDYNNNIIIVICGGKRRVAVVCFLNRVKLLAQLSL